MPHYAHPDRPGGYVALLAVLVVGAVGIAVVLSVILLGVGSSRTSFAVELSDQAKGLANACVEEALQQIRDSTPFTGAGSLTFGQGTCNYTVTAGAGENRTIDGSGTVDNVVRKAKVTVTAINPLITIGSWQEIADF